MKPQGSLTAISHDMISAVLLRGVAGEVLQHPGLQF